MRYFSRISLNFASLEREHRHLHETWGINQSESFVS